MPSQNIRKTINFVELNSTGVIHLKNHLCADTFVYGHFKMLGWTFIVHSDIEEPEYVVVSEASSGCKLSDDVNYYTVDDALHYEIPNIRSKQYYFATSVSDILVEHQLNLLRANSGVRTLAIDFLTLNTI